MKVKNESNKALYTGEPGQYLNPGESGEIAESWLKVYQQKGWVSAPKKRGRKKKADEEVSDGNEARGFI